MCFPVTQLLSSERLNTPDFVLEVRGPKVVPRVTKPSNSVLCTCSDKKNVVKKFQDRPVYDFFEVDTGVD